MKKVFVCLCAVVLLCGMVPGAFAQVGDDSKPYAGTTLRFLSMTGQISPILEEHLNEFTQATGITVKIEQYGEVQLNQKLTTEFLAGNSTVDVFMMNPTTNMPAYSRNGWVEPLDEYIESEISGGTEYDWDDFSFHLDRCRNLSTGKISAIPAYSGSPLLYYRKDVFAEKNLTPPTTYEELLDVCEKLNNPEDNFYAIACRGEKSAMISTISCFVYAHGAQWIHNGVSGFDTPEMLEGVKFYGKLLGTYAPPGVLTAGFAQMTQLFNSGLVGMAIESNALLPTLIDENESAYYDQVGIAPIPKGPRGRQPYKMVVWAIAMNSGSQNKGAAWEFIKWVTSKDLGVEYTVNGMPSFRKSVWDAELVKNALSEGEVEAYRRYAEEETSNSDGLPVLTSVTEARDIMGTVCVYSIETKGEGQELASMMKEAAQKVNDLLKAAGEYGEDYPY